MCLATVPTNHGLQTVNHCVCVRCYFPVISTVADLKAEWISFVCRQLDLTLQSIMANDDDFPVINA